MIMGMCRLHCEYEQIAHINRIIQVNHCADIVALN